MRKLNAKVEERDMSKAPLSADELDALIGKRDHLKFLNPRNELYRELGLKDAPPDRAKAIALMAKEPNLVKRPLLVIGPPGNQVLFGFDEEAWTAALGS